MVIDTSAIVALLGNEPDAERFQAALLEAETLAISAATALECALILKRRYGPAGGRNFDLLLDEQQVEVVPFDQEQLELARRAFRRFGRGRHPAQLNFGDCFAYALAKHLDEPLLFKGNDFAQTDVASAW